MERFYNALKGFESGQGLAPADSEYETRFHAAMNDDFNTPEAIGVLFELVREINRLRETDLELAQQFTALLKKLGGILGMLEMSAEEFLREGGDDIDAEHVESLIVQRKQARSDKNWALADQIRDELTALNVIVEDKDGVTSWRVERG